MNWWESALSWLADICDLILDWFQQCPLWALIALAVGVVVLLAGIVFLVVRVRRKRRLAAVGEEQTVVLPRAIVAKDAEAVALVRGERIDAKGHEIFLHADSDPAQPLVVKTYREPVPGMSRFQHLVDARATLDPRLTKRGVRALWPIQAWAARGAVIAILMDRLPQQLPGQGKGTGREVRPLSSAQDPTLRVKLLRLVGCFLHELHSDTMVYDNLALDKLYFADGPPELLVLGMDKARYLDSVPVRGFDKNPYLFTAPMAFDDDRAAYSCLAYYLLTGSTGPLPDALPQALPEGEFLDAAALGLSSESARRLEWLLRRSAAAPRGAKFPVEDWLDVLRA
jgi:hypothetical protein